MNLYELLKRSRIKFRILYDLSKILGKKYFFERQDLCGRTKIMDKITNTCVFILRAVYIKIEERFFRHKL